MEPSTSRTALPTRGPLVEAGTSPSLTQQEARLLDEALGLLITTLQPERVYLYGSRARGDSSQDSDYDLLVVVPYRVEHTYILEQKALASLWSVALPVDVLVMDRQRFEAQREVAASLPATVIREGHLLYGG